MMEQYPNKYRKITYENRFANLIIIIRPASLAFLSGVPFGTTDKINYEKNCPYSIRFVG